MNNSNAEINEFRLQEYLKANNLTWNSWHTYPTSIFADKNGKHFDIVSILSNGKIVTYKQSKSQ